MDSKWVTMIGCSNVECSELTIKGVLCVDEVLRKGGKKDLQVVRRAGTGAGGGRRSQNLTRAGHPTKN